MTEWNSLSINPRGNMPVPQWLEEWENKWQQISGKEIKDQKGGERRLIMVLWNVADAK